MAEKLCIKYGSSGGSSLISEQYNNVTEVAKMAGVGGSVSGTFTAPMNGILYAWYYAGNTSNTRYCRVSINGGEDVPTTGDGTVNSTAVFLKKGDITTYAVKSNGYSGGGVWFVGLQ